MLDPWIETYTGKKFYFLTPQKEMIDIIDIAHALSQTCRFSGHTRVFYSVAEHCINVSRLLWKRYQDPDLALIGLFHDAAEAYLTDIPTPIKQYLPEYDTLETSVLNAIYENWALYEEDYSKVKDADTGMLLKEAYYLLPSKGKEWALKYQTTYPIEGTLDCFGPNESRHEYTALFQDLIWRRYNDKTR